MKVSLILFLSWDFFKPKDFFLLNSIIFLLNSRKFLLNSRNFSLNWKISANLFAEVGSKTLKKQAWPRMCFIVICVPYQKRSQQHCKNDTRILKLKGLKLKGQYWKSWLEIESPVTELRNLRVVPVLNYGVKGSFQDSIYQSKAFCHKLVLNIA